MPQRNFYNLRHVCTRLMTELCVMVRKSCDCVSALPAHLPLPRLNVTSCNTKLCLRFLPPYSRFQEIYDSVEYQLQIKSSNTDEPKVPIYKWSRFQLCVSFLLASSEPKGVKLLYDLLSMNHKYLHVMWFKKPAAARGYHGIYSGCQKMRCFSSYK